MLLITKIISRVFWGIGAFGLLVALFFGISTLSFISQAASATGVVVGPQNPEPGRKYQSTIEFKTYNGRSVRFNTQVQSSPPEFQLGQQVPVYYNLNDPQGSARPNSFLSLWFLSLLSGGLGLIFAIVGTGFFLTGYRQRRKQKWLARYGRTITAQVVNFRLNTALRNRGKSPYVISVQWRDPASGVLHTFRSESLWIEPDSISPGQDVTVLVDPRNFQRYYVDTSALDPKQASAGRVRS